jgi:hypothetical protein
VKTLKAVRHRGPTDTLQKQLNQQTHELKEAQRHLSEVLEQQTATSEILRVIRSSPKNVQPVFDAVAESAARLCESLDCSVWRREGDRLLLVAHHGEIPQIMDWHRSTFMTFTPPPMSSPSGARWLFAWVIAPFWSLLS